MLIETFLKSDVLAIEPGAWSRLLALMELEARGANLSGPEITLPMRAAVGDRAAPMRTSEGTVAVIPILGFLFHRGGFFESLFGGRSMSEIGRAVRTAASDPNVRVLVLEIDSPGGEVGGVQELADTIFSARARKPVIAAVNTRAGSAAYWLASQAGEVVVTPSGEIGGIGVFAVHDDLSRLQERLGITTTLISAGRFKTEGNMFEPLNTGARAEIQRKVDSYHRLFVETVARGRGVTAEAVRRDFGEGRMVLAQDAVARRMADRVAPFDETMMRVVARASLARGGARARAEADIERRRRRLRLVG